MPNIRIISFGDYELYSGTVYQIGKEVIKKGVYIFPLIIKNRAYNSYTKQMEECKKTVYFISNYSQAYEIGKKLHTQDRVHLLCKLNSSKNAFVKEATLTDLHWTLVDDEAEVNVFYGSSYIKDYDEEKGYAKICTEAGAEITFWNDKEKSRALNISKVFGQNTLKSFFVTGRRSVYNDKEEYRGYYFITD